MPAHKKIQPTKICRVCEGVFSKAPHSNIVAWDKRETCSKVCGATHRNSDGSYKPIVKFCGHPKCRKPFIKNRKDTYEHFVKQIYCSISCGKLGKDNESSNSWSGDDVGYSGIHRWVNKNYGKPAFCEMCKDVSRKMYHWANISNGYRRERKDWIRLCVPCHKKFDTK